MEIQFKNITKYSKKVYNDFLIFHTQKYFGKFIFYISIIMVGLIYMLIWNLKNKNWILVLVLLLMMIIYLFYKFFLQKKIISKEMKSDKIKNEQEFEFDFYENYFVVKNQNNSDKSKYSVIKKIFETKEYFYLYINKTDALLLNKNKFIIGDVNEFNKYITKKIK